MDTSGGGVSYIFAAALSPSISGIRTDYTGFTGIFYSLGCTSFRHFS
jgi:hypothetical protein